MKNLIIIGVILAGIAVILGAFGAHGLKNKITVDYLTIYETGVKYHFYHALGIIMVGLASFHFPTAPFHISCLFFAFGILLFSGSLYVLSITGIKWLGAITPLGGLSFILGWFLTAVFIWKESIK